MINDFHDLPENCKKLHPTLGTENNVMTSPGYPHGKKHNFDCLYQFKSQNSFGLELKLEVDTESCCDFVTVRAGYTNRASFRFCC